MEKEGEAVRGGILSVDGRELHIGLECCFILPCKLGKKKEGLLDSYL